MRVQPFSLVIVLIALLACFLCVSQILRHQMLPGGGLKRYRNQPGSRSQTFSRNPQNLVLSHIKSERGKGKRSREGEFGLLALFPTLKSMGGMAGLDFF